MADIDPHPLPSPPGAELRDRIAQSLSGADVHSCQMQDGVDYRALADAVLDGEPSRLADEMPNRVTEYRISPLVDGWMTEDKAVLTLKAWGSVKHGAPTVSITKRTITDGNDTAVTTTPVYPEQDWEYRID